MMNKIYVSYAFLAVFFIGMFSGPIIHTCFDWSKTIEVWKDWQTLTAAMIALTASIVVFHVTQYNEGKQRQRNFIAARAFLPDAFARIIEYCNASLKVYGGAWKDVPEGGADASALNRDIHPYPAETYERIKESLLYAPEEFSSYLTRILVLLQKFQSRMKAHFQYVAGSENSSMRVSRDNLLSDMLMACYIKSMIANIFEYVRGEKSFENIRPDCNSVMSSFRTAGLAEYVYHGLEEFFSRRVSSMEREILSEFDNKKNKK